MRTGLYIHIPFCDKICNYCDFPKTARFNEEIIKKYFFQLEAHLKIWLQVIPNPLCSVYFGGGTPGLFAKEYKNLFKLFIDRCTSNPEITIEANPQNITENSLKIWKDLGINRLSLGVQSFNEKALKFLTRSHDKYNAEKSIDLSQKYFSNINIDLIYGWKDQTFNDWKADLLNTLTFSPSHLSLYCLTYAPKTPLGLRYDRYLKNHTIITDDFLADLYEYSCDFLALNNYIHEEISNWAKENAFSVHNSLYWSGEYYISIGMGAHGFLQDGSIGRRYSYPDNIKDFLNGDFNMNELNIEHRSIKDWVYEYIGCSLRYKDGIDINLIETLTQMRFNPSPKVQIALDDGILTLKDEKLFLAEKDWFRETGWSLEVIDSFS